MNEQQRILLLPSKTAGGRRFIPGEDDPLLPLHLLLPPKLTAGKNKHGEAPEVLRLPGEGAAGGGEDLAGERRRRQGGGAQGRGGGAAARGWGGAKGRGGGGGLGFGEEKAAPPPWPATIGPWPITAAPSWASRLPPLGPQDDPLGLLAKGPGPKLGNPTIRPKFHF